MSNYNQAEFYFKRAETIYGKGDYQKAIEFCDKVIDLCSAGANIRNRFLEDSLLQRAFSYWHLNGYPEAIEDCDQIIEFAPNNPYAWAIRGLSYAGLGNNHKAAEDLSIAFEIEPKDVWILEQLISFYSRMSDYQAALEYAKQWVKLEPKLILAQLTIGYIYVRLGDADNASRVYSYSSGLIGVGGYRTAKELAGKEWVLVDAGEGAVCRLKKEFERALSILNNSIREYDGSGWVWAERGELYKQLGSFTEAIADFEKALSLDKSLTWVQKSLEECKRNFELQDEFKYREIIKKNPNSIDTYVLLVEELLRKGCTEKARTSIQGAIEINPNAPELFYALGQIQRKLGQFYEAEDSFRQAIKRGPEFIPAFLDLGDLLIEQDRTKEALDTFNRVLDIDPYCRHSLAAFKTLLGEQSKKEMQAYPYLKKAQELEKNGSFQGAEEALRTAIKLAPDYVAAYFSLGVVLYDQNRKQDAEMSFRKVIELDPGAHDAYSWLAVILQEQKRVEEAEDAYLKAIRYRPPDAEYYYYYSNYGTFLSTHERLSEAESAFRKAIQLNSEDSASYTSLGDILFKQGRLEEAEAAYSKRVELNPKDTDTKEKLKKLFSLRKNGKKKFFVF